MSTTNVSTRRAFNTFDIKPSAPPPAGVIDFDELIINWGSIPVGTVAKIYWPAVPAAQVLKLANSRYAFHTLGTSDAHTVQCLTTRRLSYVPIPANSGPKFAGLISIEMPASVAVGQTYTIIIQRVTSYTPPPPFVPPPIQSPVVSVRLEATPARVAHGAARGAGKRSSFVVGGGGVPPSGPPINRNVTMTSWRTIAGAFQINIPVQPAAELLPFAENTLAVFKFRLSVTPATNRWHPVLVRYIDYLSEQIDANGGSASSIEPSQTGLPGKVCPGSGKGEDLGNRTHCGKVAEVLFDCHGDFYGFVLDECCARQVFETRERAIGELVRDACRDGLTLCVTVEEKCWRIARLAVTSA